jgi:hypothetical protein
MSLSISSYIKNWTFGNECPITSNTTYPLAKHEDWKHFFLIKYPMEWRAGEVVLFNKIDLIVGVRKAIFL